MSLTLIIGPMFSGKSTELIRRLSIYTAFDYKILVVNHLIDTRSSEVLSCRNFTGTFNGKKVATLSEVPIDFDVIGIDEAQFFPDLYEGVQRFLKAGVIVIVSGLNGDRNQQPFGEISRLLPLVDELIHVKAMCRLCPELTPAPFTKSLTRFENQVAVSENYIAVCRKHL